MKVDGPPVKVNLHDVNTIARFIFFVLSPFQYRVEVLEYSETVFLVPPFRSHIP